MDLLDQVEAVEVEDHKEGWEALEIDVSIKLCFYLFYKIFVLLFNIMQKAYLFLIITS